MRDPIVRCVALCWLITKLICYPLWMADRFFPLAPVNEILLKAPAYLHTVIFCLSLICLVLLVIVPRKQMAIALLLLEAVACLLDQNRWQPWEYLFLFFLAAFVFIKDIKSRDFSWQLIIIGFYFFSGLSKCNSNFIIQVWKEQYLKQLSGMVHADAVLLRMGYVLPLLELGSAVALCFKRSTRVGVMVLIALHLINLVVYGLFASSTSSTLLPWNVVMPVLLVLLFYREGVSFSKREIWKPLFIKLVLLCWWIIPCLQLAGVWECKYFSGSLYSGKTNYMYICTEDLSARLRLTDYFIFTKYLLPCSTALSVYQWGIKEMKAPPFPAEGVYETIALRWNTWYPDGKNRFFLVGGGVKKSVRPLLLP